MAPSYSRSFIVSAVSAVAFYAIGASAEEVGRIGVDWVGNDIIIEAVEDPGGRRGDLPCVLF